ncbi:MAG: S-layer homology domain-containing protein [Phormidium sp. GEM2.Bin31]|nr:MAG: S-layer homology domain-containing protein [Phormidium sp. GEM2.Bin31]
MKFPPVALIALAAAVPSAEAVMAASVGIQLPDNCNVVALSPAESGRAGGMLVCAPESPDGPAPILGNNIDIPDLPESVEFADLGDRYERPFIEALARQGIIPAAEDEKFNPDDPLTEAELRAWLDKSLEIRETMNPSLKESSEEALEDSSLEEEAQAAKATGKEIHLEHFGKRLTGKSVEKDVEPVVSRLEALVALATHFDLELTEELEANTVLSFTDLDRVPETAHNALKAIVGHEIIILHHEEEDEEEELEEMALYPHFSATRADVAVLLYKSMVKSGGFAPIAMSSQGSLGEMDVRFNGSGEAIYSPLVRPGLMQQLFADSYSPGTIAIGLAEGTRTVEGGKTTGYWGHRDPGNGKHNMGTFSYQHGARTPEEADLLQLRRIYQYSAALEEYAAAHNMELSVLELVAGLDLANQAPLAAQHYLANLQEAKARGATGIDAILEARAYSYFNPATGRLEASGFRNNWEWLRYDQLRRIHAIHQTLAYHGIE